MTDHGALRKALLAGVLIVSQGAVSATPPIETVVVEADGATINEARGEAVRAALLKSLEQLVLTDRLVENGRFVRERLLATANGYVRGFETLDIQRLETGVLIEAEVTVASTDIANYIDYLSDGQSSAIDGESVFGELQRRQMQAVSLRNIFRHLLRGIPLRRFDVDVLSLVTADPDLVSKFHAIPLAEQSLDVIFEGAMNPDVGASLRAFLGSLDAARDWSCSDPRRPVTLDWHDGSISPAWTQCSDLPGSFRQYFSACTTDNNQQTLNCTSVDPNFADGKTMASKRHRFVSSRNRGNFIYAFLDSAGRPTARGASCRLLSVEANAPRSPQVPFSGVVYPMRDGAPHLWETTPPPFALASHHAISDETPRRFFARIPVADVNLTATETLRIGLVWRRSDGLFVSSLASEALRFNALCEQLLSND